ncbi:cell division protein FtsZ [Thermodesulfobacteriota bacterium]
MMFQLVENEKSAKIKVIGVGGAGCNAINNMIADNLQGVKFIVANTDSQSLEVSPAPVRIQMGEKLTGGLGAGANPEIGQEAALEASDKLREVLDESHMVFITAGMGGGTGTGAAPIIAQICKELGILTVGVVTKPFQFEGKRRSRLAQEGLQALRDVADTVITIPNDRLRSMATKNATLPEMFKKADEVLLHSVKGITDLILKPGLVNLDFADVRETMSKGGTALMGIGMASGENRALEAAEKALYHPLLEDVSIAGARAVLMNITCGPDLGFEETVQASDRIYKEAGDDAAIIWGTAVDGASGDELRLTLIATGIGSDTEGKPRLPHVRGKLREMTAEDIGEAVNLDEPTFIRKRGAVGESARSVYRGFKGIILDNDDLDIPTFMRKNSS